MEKDQFHIYNGISEMEIQDQDLITAASGVLDQSYAPYSNFHVAAAILISNGEIITGVNQENASSPAGLCAEQVALYRKGIEWPNEKIISMAIVARRSDKKSVAISPCGNCRQVMVEFVHRQAESFPVIMQWENDSWLRINSMESLLPFSFTAKSR
ncbi:MAG: cytidine deaminase [Cyclobacteriaceae bacterium]